MTVLGSLAVSVLGIAGVQPAPRPPMCQHARMGTLPQRMLHPCSWDVHIGKIWFMSLHLQKEVNGSSRIPDLYLKYLRCCCRSSPRGSILPVNPFHSSVLPDSGIIFVIASKASAVLGEWWFLFFDRPGLCCCSLLLCSERFRDVTANSSPLRCSFYPWFRAARPHSPLGTPGSRGVRSLQADQVFSLYHNLPWKISCKNITSRD